MLSFLWQVSRGYRLTPWRSPYLRWRMETYWGMHADDITKADFFQFLGDHRRELFRFVRWAARMRSAS